MYNTDLSVEIYQTLTAGKIINNRMLNNSGQCISNPLFEEIMNNLSTYATQYEMSGQELVRNKDFVYLRKGAELAEDVKTDVTMKAALLLLMLGKYINEQNYRFSKLTEQNGGITKTDILALQEIDDIQELIEKARLKSDLFTEFKNVLINRNLLLELPGNERFILSDAGRVFYEEVVRVYLEPELHI
ncbi:MULTISPECIES: condensin complex protein MksE [Aliiglaciecola]|uniref:condensin complex protein MksE n=1 Tax=Aliiglaciecola TaxID=1406885 RepID=UPI001C088D81|nr:MULTISPECIES: hypothetical protein [Aliiglaciecola]MBU2878741.1 hypothetical protein [Aliiglaciecola lipolytica]MDO6711362.1 hypothetical protein [Aliiglaciecola sp. 2_MG-2023]MDO6752189.1 hypothetical protein [Aliiglaciecola sp. 1_MG-2023]